MWSYPRHCQRLHLVRISSGQISRSDDSDEAVSVASMHFHAIAS